MKNAQWGAWFKVKRQLDQSELGRYADYIRMCRELWYAQEAGDYAGASEEVWRVENGRIPTI